MESIEDTGCSSQNNSILKTTGIKYNYDSAVPSRLERLLREREIRKSSRSQSTNEGIRDGCRDSDVFGNGIEPCLSDGDKKTREEALIEGLAAVSPSNGFERKDGRSQKQRLLVVANRLPVSAVRKGEDSWTLEVSVGGLVSALLGVNDFEANWIGWSGVNVTDEIGQRSLTVALAEKRCIPVFLDQETVNQYYNGYCNNILWPLFHYLPLPQEDRLATTRSFQSQFAAYKKANQMFADVVNEHYQEGDIVWCHDYHLMFLPKCLKEYNSQMKVGWFLHTPFPSSEIHRTLPSRSELLRAVLAADLVGFHTYDYARHFVSACTRILGLEGTPEGVEDQGKLTRVAAFPIGIDSDRFIRALDLPPVKYHINELQERFAGRKVMLGVDRLDMIKGIPQKILAFEKFLEENPDWRDKVVLLQIAVPTRTDVPEYQKLTCQVHEIVGRINGRFGTLTAVPIHHLDRSLDFPALCALYAVTDVALVTSLRDGMNLVSYEFVACQASKKGVLILSEFAGAAQSLGAGAILVNPWNITELASSIGYALTMSAQEREKRHHHNFSHVTTHTSQEWAETFVSELNDTVVEAQLRTRQIPPQLPSKVAIERYTRSNNRLLILGFNATLTEPVDAQGRRIDQLKEMELKLHPDLKEPLRKLCNDPKTTVVVLSGSDRNVLDENFGEYRMWLAAEHGMFLRLTEGNWMTTMPENLSMDWVDSVKHVFEYFTERTPRSHFELRETSLVWNYKYTVGSEHADIEFGKLQAKDLLQHLYTGPISNASVDVIQGCRSVEVRAVGVTKGAAIDRILGEIVHNNDVKTPIDYVLCIGHFLAKDEDIYSFFEPELPQEQATPARTKIATHLNRNTSNHSTGKSAHRAVNYKVAQQASTLDKAGSNENGNWWSMMRDRMTVHEGSSVLDLKADNYFSCAVGRNCSKARYLLGSSPDVVSLLKDLANTSSCGAASSYK
ncbi:alpha,alpha-trehalose-phosphate synthase [UDP-forming] 1-like isoform X1 [Lycium ferocissimum]|uniref:alpha,alpha-trehalose-phosphate synthase [UDP-forming] 1-like isoform X1 n=1 Tax=Lycium ferocissimum TaxID=112874 RepID=UPI002816217A|nr:alpha,alpha-trehalose-phosphate synthase [UDP-forming] 1-like isoform X1 [Lycium ferocissimum]XP_059289834.1 alpha,alpha-trehalose-phosphate synthase [UDP-forming] 1-like isoform X1 [Lycium ferocissimum]XP_059289840.1 alpha,alpha-trehalose-phosphate synthase [UDP-forming] 1-like isoform X1 [Lycium ferocissimum]XP_059289847.1 alpha,alpha-trehalose-phosphate synthase [UDP-forming] 1-like isoform X1 [Lycium ferocissimum]XP_059289854.1 alpha,alpha-trehalose-phosphate synthase [UDP-forming] 1-lik